MTTSYHRLISLSSSILFVIAVQIFATPQPAFRFLLSALAGFLALLGGYNYWYLRHTAHWNIWLWLRPLLFFLGWFALFAVIPDDTLKGLVLLLGVVLGYFMENWAGIAGETVVFNATLLTAFSFAIAFFGLVYYLALPGLAYLALVFAAILILLRSSFEFTPAESAGKWSNSFVIAIFLLELFWVLNFLPPHFSALALLWFSAFYAIWTLQYYQMFHHLTIKKLQLTATIALAFCLIIIFATPWHILLK